MRDTREEKIWFLLPRCRARKKVSYFVGFYARQEARQ